MRATTLAISILLAAPACTGGGGKLAPSLAVTRTDSADVWIISHDRPTWAGESQWQLDTSPRLIIGDVDGRPDYQLSRVRGLTRLGDGRIAVLNGQSNEVLLLERDGRLVRRIGRQGPGPGEFYSPQHLERLPRSRLRVWDENFGARSTFDTSGALLLTEGIDRWRLNAGLEGIGSGEWFTPIGGGAFVAHVRPHAIPQATDPIGELIRRPLAFVMFDTAYNARLLGWYKGLSLLKVRGPGGSVQPAVPLFPYMSDVTAGGEPLRIFITGGDQFEVDVFDATGSLLGKVRRTRAPIRIGEAAIDSMRRDFLGRIESDSIRERTRRAMEPIPVQEVYPPTRRIIADVTGCVWVQSPGDGWSVFQPDGGWAAQLDVRLTRIWEVGTDYVLGISVDSLGVESIREFMLRRAPGSGCRSP